MQENRREITGMNKVVTVAGNRSTEVGGDEVVRVGGAYTLSIAAAGRAPTVSTFGAGHVRFDNGAGAAIELEGSTVRLRASRVEIVADALWSPDPEQPETSAPTSDA